MLSLIRFEFAKVWRKKNFVGLIILLLLLNIFFIWYSNQPSENDPPLSSYQALSQDIANMSESEKLTYIQQLKEQIDGVLHVKEVQSFYALGNEMGNTLAEQVKEKNPGMYEQYEDLYNRGDYLIYTDTLEKEYTFIYNIYEEITTVANYDTYLASIQEQSVSLNGISIFQDTADTFSNRNIQKSANDHEGLTSTNIKWYPSKGLIMALQHQPTDILIILSVFLFVAQLIIEEKEKGLLAITRATKRGLCFNIGAKILALLLHCSIICLLLYGSNILYAYITTGIGDIFASVQSMAPWIESSLSISICTFLIYYYLTKVIVIFLFGLLIFACAIYTSLSFMPQLLGIGFLSIHYLLYTFLPSTSNVSLLKHLSYFSLLRVENLYGRYLNLNISGYPIERFVCALVSIVLLLFLLITLILFLYCFACRLTIKQTKVSIRFPFHPYSHLFRHEGYKILITNRVLLILFTFLLLIGYHDLHKNYTLSSGEQYYQDMMLKLEGELTDEKETLIASEQARYEEAFTQIENIEAKVNEGTLREDIADGMKEQWYGVLSFYPYFLKIQSQYEYVTSTNGVFIYDTGYLYLLGKLDDSFLIDLLLISLFISFAYANVMAMEDNKGMWKLLSTTQKGKKKVILHKWLICIILSTIITIIPWVLRFLSISSSYPIRQLLVGIQCIPAYKTFVCNLPILIFLLLVVVIQIIVIQVITSFVFLMSKWRRNHFQTLFLSLVVFVVPLVLAAMGLTAMKWFSLWPIFSWTGLL